MRIRKIHDWNLSAKTAVQLQNRLARRVIAGNHLPRKIRILAGCDISTSRASKTGYAGVVLLDAASLDTLAEFTLKGALNFPYVPGLLSFREGPLLLQLFQTVSPQPDLIFFDGHGLAHPRRFGLACHMGLCLNRPTLGCAKSRLTGEHRQPGKRKGAYTWLKDVAGDTLGAVVRTRDHCKPVYVSIGHQIDLESAVHWTLHASGRYRIPEPTRRAHLLVNEFRRQDA